MLQVGSHVVSPAEACIPLLQDGDGPAEYIKHPLFCGSYVQICPLQGMMMWRVHAVGYSPESLCCRRRMMRATLQRLAAVSAAHKEQAGAAPSARGECMAM